jgi:hypothetical protein
LGSGTILRRMKRRDLGRGATLLGVSLLLAACAGADGPQAGTISTKDYDLSCTSVADCVPVSEGMLGCCQVTCPNAAVPKAVLAKYDADLKRIMACPPNVMCGGTPPGCPAPGTCNGPPFCAGGGRITCDNGACALATPSADAATSE